MRHIVRNSMTPILVQATIDIGTVVLAAGSLAFIGLGAQPPFPDWGLMVAEGRGADLVLLVDLHLPGPRDLRHRPRLQLGRRRPARLVRPPAGEAMTSLLSVRDLTVEFVDRGRVSNRPIRGVDLELARGEVLGVVGETGCGKSLTGLSVLGLMPSGARTTGQVVFDGVDQLTASASDRAAMRGDAVSIVFQNPGTAFNPVFTIGAQMSKALRRHRPMSRSRARQVILRQLERVGLPDPDRVAAAYPHELSGRHVAAGDDRHRAAVRARAADPGRAHHGARRHGAPSRSCS